MEEGEVKLLGVTINGEGQQAAEMKRNEAMDCPKPTNIKNLRGFLGLTGWLGNFIMDYSGKRTI